ncbi:hypothetical protein EYF80_031373 [Liparis tanakae]|uniref:Uncharacterized protein n=1 Tax=Liparis tanakae TaxID=230148 RepID=A0A4Z2H0K0_9TELE|nr:hypothetical protein EYF80_031373 [Liparis tanakae]
MNQTHLCHSSFTPGQMEFRLLLPVGRPLNDGNAAEAAGWRDYKVTAPLSTAYGVQAVNSTPLSFSHRARERGL